MKTLAAAGKLFLALAISALVLSAATASFRMSQKFRAEQAYKAAERHLTVDQSQAVDKLERLYGVTLDQLAPEAKAADALQCVLTSTDAGPTNTCALLGNQQLYEIWCAIPACYKTDKLVGTAGANSGTIGDGGINCAFDVPAYVYNGASLANQNTSGPQGVPSLPRFQFNAGIHTGIWAFAADGGNPACNVSLVIGGK